MNIEFFKYQGTGNDFIIIDNRSLSFNKNDNEFISSLCDRKFGIGADGLILLEKDLKHDFKMIYFNADGSESTMCGNGGRCIVMFANHLNIINNKASFVAVDGVHEAYIKEDLIFLKMNDVSKIINVKDGYILNTGSPHYVRKIDSLSNIDLIKESRLIRNDKSISDKGVNVNFAEVKHSSQLKLRTYERGVEDETLSCGTGVVASVVSLYLNNFLKGNYVDVITRGGNLSVSFDFENSVFKNIWLIGPAVKSFKGVI